LDARRQFRASPDDDSTTPALTRTRDRVLINRRGSLDLVRQQIAGFAKSLADSDFQGFPTDGYHSSVLQMPAQMQVSICGGTQCQEKDASHVEESALVASTHNFFHKHLDSAGANHLGELGVLGWLRSQHLRRRYLTCLVYLNPDWKEGDGGCLRMFTGNKGDPDELGGDQDAESFVDIPPLAGRLIVFSSPRQVHAVLPTNVQRYACAVWLAL
jgi:2OG-Fe(II) oxygenase superfamily